MRSKENAKRNNQNYDRELCIHKLSVISIISQDLLVNLAFIFRNQLSSLPFMHIEIVPIA